MRITIQDYACHLAEVSAERSEDPYRKVGAVALTSDNRVIATAYNGLLAGFEYHNLPLADGLHRDYRLPFMVHAEQNLCSLIKRNEATWVATTVCPCPSCLLLLAAHDIKTILYLNEYERSGNESKRIAEHYNIDLRKHGE